MRLIAPQSSVGNKEKRGKPNSMRNERGSALLFTIIVTFVLLFLGGALGLFSMVEQRQVQLAEADLQAYYLARSGADAVAQYIIDEHNDVDLSKIVGVGYSQDVPFGPDGTISVEIEETTSGFLVRSKGTVGVRERVVELELLGLGSTVRQFEVEQAIMARGLGSNGSPAIHIHDQGHIFGNVITNTEADGSIKTTDGSINGDIFVGPGAKLETVVSNLSKVTGTVDHMKIPVDYPSIHFPDIPDVGPRLGKFTTTESNKEIKSDGYWDTLETSDYLTLTIDLNYGVRNIVVRELRLKYGAIELKNVGETGQLRLFVEESIVNSSENGRINISGEGSSRSSALSLYYYGTRQTPDTYFNMVGNLFSRTANVKLANNARIVGSVFSGGSIVEVMGSATTIDGIIYAPNAKVRVNNGGNAGPVVGYAIEVSGSGSVTFSEDKAYDSTFPSDAFESDGNGGVPSGYSRGSWSSGS